MAEGAPTGRSRVVAVAVVAALAGGAGGFAGGWSAHRAPAPRAVARGPVERARDTDRDGRPDRVEIYVDGRLNRVDYDSDRDGRFDSVDEMSATGRVLFTRTDRDWNTVAERWIQRGASGEVVSEWVDANQDGAPERFRAFDAAARMTEEGVDANSDGIYELHRVFNTRWPAGSPPSKVEHDDDGDGLYELRESFDRAGRRLAVNADTDRDGVRDRVTLLDGRDHVVREGYDRDGDGAYEEWRYPVEGGARVAHDDDGDEDLDRWDPPGPPTGWCAARCVVRPAR